MGGGPTLRGFLSAKSKILVNKERGMGWPGFFSVEYITYRMSFKSLSNSIDYRYVQVDLSCELFEMTHIGTITVIYEY